MAVGLLLITTAMWQIQTTEEVIKLSARWTVPRWRRRKKSEQDEALDAGNSFPGALFTATAAPDRNSSYLCEGCSPEALRSPIARWDKDTDRRPLAERRLPTSPSAVELCRHFLSVLPHCCREKLAARRPRWSSAHRRRLGHFPSFERT